MWNNKQQRIRKCQEGRVANGLVPVEGGNTIRLRRQLWASGAVSTLDGTHYKAGLVPRLRESAR